MSLIFHFGDVAFDGWYEYTYKQSDTLINPLITQKIGVAVSLWIFHLENINKTFSKQQLFAIK